MKTQNNARSRLTVAVQLIGFVAMISPIAVDADDAIRDLQRGNDNKLKVITEITVIDANHKTVGQIGGPFPVGVCGGSPVPYKVGSRIFSVSVNKAGFVKCGKYSFFESSNCSGTPFVQVDTDTFIEGAHIGEPGSTVYLPNLNDVRQNFQSHSSLTDYSGECFAVDNIINYAAPEIQIINLDDIFTPPFKVRTGYLSH